MCERLGFLRADAGIYGFCNSWIGTVADGAFFLVGGWFGDWYSDDEGHVIYTGKDLNQPNYRVDTEFIYGQPFFAPGRGMS